LEVAPTQTTAARKLPQSQWPCGCRKSSGPLFVSGRGTQSLGGAHPSFVELSAAPLRWQSAFVSQPWPSGVVFIRSVLWLGRTCERRGGNAHCFWRPREDSRGALRLSSCC